jgi:hypothetical protein
VYLSSNLSTTNYNENDDPLNYDLIVLAFPNPLGCASEVEFNKIG